MKTLLNSLTLASLTLATFLGAAQEQAQAQNPIVGGSASSSISYDPFNDHTYIDNTTNTVRQSYFDANRNNVDPGSYKYVDRQFVDSNGQLVREYGYTWTSFGKPHGNLTREKVTTYYPAPSNPGCPLSPGGGTTIYEQGNVQYSQPFPGNNGVVTVPGGGTTVRDRQNVLYSRQLPNNGRRIPGSTTVRDRQNVAYSVAQPPQPQGQGRNSNNNNRRGGFFNRVRNQVQFKSFTKRK